MTSQRPNLRDIHENIFEEDRDEDLGGRFLKLSASKPFDATEIINNAKTKKPPVDDYAATAKRAKTPQTTVKEESSQDEDDDDPDEELASIPDGEEEVTHGRRFGCSDIYR